MKALTALLLLLYSNCANTFLSDAEKYQFSENTTFEGTIVLDVVSSILLDRYPGEKCNRLCTRNTRRRVCYFKWTMENYHTMGPACGGCAKGIRKDCYHPLCITADGFERGVMSINRRIPGPQINVCKNDLLVVDVDNRMMGTSVSIHWHGLHQRRTPWMDGVPFVTQCPIDFSTTFRYTFWASEAGTQFYHSHSGHHKVNGHYGALVVRESIASHALQRNVFYDFDLVEHTMLISDWMHMNAENAVPGLVSSQSIGPVNILINGRGVFKSNLRDDETTVLSPTPLEVFRIQKGNSYRFRFINSASHACTIQLQIENHRMEFIASDSYPHSPIIADTLISTSGERYDFIIHADQPIRNYWIRVRYIGNCEFRRIEQFGVLTYMSDEIPLDILAFPREVAPTFENKFPNGVTLNHPNATCHYPNDDMICISDAESYVPAPDIVETKPDVKLFIAFNTYVVKNEILFSPDNYDAFMNIRNNLTIVGAINNISLTFPSFPPLTQPWDIKVNTFCDGKNKPDRCKNRNVCPCVHRLVIALNATVELVIVDESQSIGPINHPFHLHGHQFYVVGSGQPTKKRLYTATVKRIDGSTGLNRIKMGRVPVLKDTVSVPSGGYTIIRFRANNPGFWLMHCHFEWHLGSGMGLIFQVGDSRAMPKRPFGFPTCGSYLPKIG